MTVRRRWILLSLAASCVFGVGFLVRRIALEPDTEVPAGFDEASGKFIDRIAELNGTDWNAAEKAALQKEILEIIRREPSIE